MMTIQRKASNWFALAAAGTVAMTGRVALAQDSEGALRLEEVTVTARKVEENLMTVPLAITALSAKDLEATNVKQLTDIAQITPSFYFVNQTGGGSGRADRSFNSLTFRGLFLNQNQGISAGGLLFVDGAPVIGAQPPAVVDVERVEVLKGPQSAYFGRSTFVGAINFVTRDPSTDEFKGRVSAEYSRWDSYDAALNLEGPLAETLAARLTLRSFERGGFYDNVGGSGAGELGKQGTDSISTSLVWQPTDSLKIKTYLNFFRDDDGPPAHGAIKPAEFNGRVAPDGSCVPFSQAPAGTAALGQAAGSRASFGYWCGELPGADGVVPVALSGDYDVSPTAINSALFSPNPLWPVFDPGFKDEAGLRRDAYQGDIRIDWEFGGGYSLSSLSAYHSDKMQSVIDLNFRDGRALASPFFTPATAATRVPWLAFPLVVQTKQRDWSQELRLTSPQENRFRWVLGANYFDAYSPGGPVYGLAPIGPLFASAVTQQTVETPAVFGAAYFDVTDTVTISAEARKQRDEITQKPIIGGAGTPVTGTAATILNAKFDSFSPRLPSGRLQRRAGDVVAGGDRRAAGRRAQRGSHVRGRAARQLRGRRQVHVARRPRPHHADGLQGRVEERPGRQRDPGHGRGHLEPVQHRHQQRRRGPAGRRVRGLDPGDAGPALLGDARLQRQRDQVLWHRSGRRRRQLRRVQPGVRQLCRRDRPRAADGAEAHLVGIGRLQRAADRGPHLVHPG
jgi:iron complex outermembrane recepter protein